MSPIKLISASVFTGFLLLVIVSSSAPALAATFQNPLGGNDMNPGAAIAIVIVRTLGFIMGFAGVIAIVAIAYGGLRIVVGAVSSEAEIARAKQIILWAVIGLLVIGLAATILSVVGKQILGV